MYGLMQMDDAEGVTSPVLIHQCRVDEVASFCAKRVDSARRSEAPEGDDLWSMGVVTAHSGRLSLRCSRWILVISL